MSDPSLRAGTPVPMDQEIERLTRRLAEAESALQAVISGEVDAVAHPSSDGPILLRDAQEALRRSEERYRDFVAESPTIVCELAPDGTALFVNRRVGMLLGYQPMDLLGRNFWDVVIPDDERARFRAMWEYLLKGNVGDLESTARAMDGTRRKVLWNSVRRNDAGGSLESLIVFGLDITERDRAEENARLYAQAAEARAEAEAANKAKSEFLANMSHELRTPLNAIGGYVQLLEEGIAGELNAKQLEYLRRTHRSQEHLLGLINDVLNFAKLEAGRVQFDVSNVKLSDTLAEVDDLILPQVAEKGLVYKNCGCDADVSVRADPDKLRQILLNLVSNAVKFTPTGGRISIACEAQGSHVGIAVQDSGIGVPTDKRDAIFEPFVQVGKGPDRQGTGLGLSISRELARAMKGDLTLTTEVGRGSTFTVTVPRAASSSAPDSPGASRQSSGRTQRDDISLRPEKAAEARAASTRE